MGESLRTLVERHGYGIWVQQYEMKYEPFQVLSKTSDTTCCIRYASGNTYNHILLECPSCDDYVVIPSPVTVS